MELTMPEKIRATRQAVREFCEREIVPIAMEIDQEARFPWEVVEKMGHLGYFGIQVPAALGGAAMDSCAYATVIEEISRASGALGLCVSVHNSVVVYPILKFGTDEQIERWVPLLASGKKIGAFCLTEPNAGSDASAIEASAVRDGSDYIVNANKIFVTNGGVADICLIFVKMEMGHGKKKISTIVVERGTLGFAAGVPEDLSGMRANPVCSIRLSDCRVPAENRIAGEGQGLAVGMDALDTGRIGIAAQAVGIAQAALDESVTYARQRKQFGVALARHQAIQMMIAEMATDVEAARAMVMRAALLRDAGKAYTMESAMAKLFCGEAACRVADKAVQIHGGYGYSRSYPVERYYRDARVTRIYEGTAEIQKLVIARQLLA